MLGPNRVGESPVMRWEDAYRQALADLTVGGSSNVPTRGSTRELIGHSLAIESGRDRLLLGHPIFDPIPSTGHLLWTLAGRSDLESIQYYNPAAARFSVDRTKLHGAYGPRLFGIGVFDQINRNIELLRDRPSTRRAVATIYSPEFDTFRRREGDREDEVPCTVALQWLPRQGALSAITFMRSQDALRLLPLDMFVFTVIQEFIASSVGLEVGHYHHHAGSFHLYEKDAPRIDAYRQKMPEYAQLMPKMPPGGQTEHLNAVLSFEERIRNEAVGLRNGRAKLNEKRYLRDSESLPDFWRLTVHSLLAWAGSVLESEKILKAVVNVIHPSFQPFVRRHLQKNSPQAALETYREPLV